MVELFREGFMYEVYENLRKILAKVEKSHEELCIDTRGISKKDAVIKKRNPEYLSNEYIKFTDDGISVIYGFKDLYRLIKSSIPKTIKRLRIPFMMLDEEIKELLNFPELEEVEFSDDCYLDRNEVEFLFNNTKIKKIRVKNTSFDKNDVLSPEVLFYNGFTKLFYYEDILIRSDKCDENFGDKGIIVVNDFSSDFEKILEVSLDDIHIHKNFLRIDNKETYNNNSLGPVLIFFENDRIINELVINIDIVEDYEKIIDDLLAKGYIINTMSFIVSNKTYSKMYEMKKYERMCSLNIIYDSSYCDEDFINNNLDILKISLDEFINMRANFDYFKELIGNSELSPLEKITFAYDIVKMEFSNNSSKIVENDVNISRQYSNFYKQLLKELGFYATTCNVMIEENINSRQHQRNLVRVDDDKYKIHGVFAMDVIFDGMLDLKEEALIFYRHFLIPVTDYIEVFKNETIPEVLGIFLTKRKDFSSLTEHNLDDLFGKKELTKEIKRYIKNSQKPSLENFENILLNVRRSEGYNNLDTLKNIEMIVETNQEKEKYLFFKKEG